MSCGIGGAEHEHSPTSNELGLEFREGVVPVLEIHGGWGGLVVEVRVTQERVTAVTRDGRIVAEHRRSFAPHRTITAEHGRAVRKLRQPVPDHGNRRWGSATSPPTTAPSAFPLVSSQAQESTRSLKTALRASQRVVRSKEPSCEHRERATAPVRASTSPGPPTAESPGSARLASPPVSPSTSSTSPSKRPCPGR